MEVTVSMILALVAVTSVSAFEFTKVEPKSVKVKEGENVVLSCTVDDWYEWCTFVHGDKNATME